MSLLFSLVFDDFSAWWIILCLAIGFLYAWVFYQKSNLENQNLKYVLFSLRMISISLLLLLLLSPLFKTTTQTLEKPLIIIAQDASASIAVDAGKGLDTTQYRRDFEALAKQMKDNYDVEVFNFSDKLNPGFNFEQKGKQTDLSVIFSKVEDAYARRNIGGIIIASDGIYNQGANPLTQIADVRYPVYTIALGDTIAKKDIVLLMPNYNRLVYVGNNHEVELVVKAHQANGLSTILKAATSDGQTKQQRLAFNKDDETKTIRMEFAATRKGIQKIDFQLQAIANEISVENNTQTIFVDVLDGKEKILILADAPHPDLSALKRSIEQSQNYEVTLAFAQDVPKDLKPFGLVILHNLPSAKFPINSVMASIAERSKWFIVGMQTDLTSFNQSQNLVSINGSGQPQVYLPKLKSDFYPFRITGQSQQYLEKATSLMAPSGSYESKSNTQILFDGQSPNATQNIPLLAVKEELTHKDAVLIGEGVWRWRMENFEDKENFEAFDELINRTVQYLSVKQDKRKFRAEPSKTRFSENEDVLLKAELYDDSYQLNNTPEVAVEIKDKNGQRYSYMFSKKDQAYQLNASILPAGEYDFTASTTLGDKKHISKGSFLITETNVELLNTLADHQLLYHISDRTGGVMVYPKAVLQIRDLLKKNEKVKTIARQDESYKPFINLQWIFALVVLLLSFEWFLRKRNGSI